MPGRWRYLQKDMRDAPPRRWTPCTAGAVSQEVSRYFVVSDPALDALIEGMIVITPRYHFRAERYHQDQQRAECSVCQAPRPLAELGERCPECFRGDTVKAGPHVEPRPARLVGTGTKAPNGTAYCLNCGAWYTTADIDKECHQCRNSGRAGIIARAGWCKCEPWPPHGGVPLDRWGRCQNCERVRMTYRGGTT